MEHTTLLTLFKTEAHIPQFCFFSPHYVDTWADKPIIYHQRSVVSFLSYTF